MGNPYIQNRLEDTTEVIIKQADVKIEAVYKDATPITPPGPAKYALKVDGGIGSGDYSENSEVIIKHMRRSQVKNLISGNLFLGMQSSKM